MMFYRGYTIRAVSPRVYAVYITAYRNRIYYAESVKEAREYVDMEIFTRSAA